jgi:EmrB/QacA subfamily drug resistance transporter
MTTTRSKWLTLAAVCLGLGMLMIDTFVVNVALPAIGRDLKTSVSAIEWTVTAYVLVIGVFPVAMGRLGDIFGRKRVYLLGLVLFVLASAAAGLAQNIQQLISFRVLQGLGAATMMPGTLSIITQAFPARQRGLAIGIWGGVSGLGLLAGPILGGLLVQDDSWRWIFFVNVPIGIAAIVSAFLFVPESRDESAPRSVDLPGLVLLSGGLFLVILGISRGNDLGWSSGWIVSWFVAGALLLLAFVAVEQRVSRPLVDLTLFRNWTFVAACLSAMLFSMAVFGSQPFTSLFMQNYWGFSPLQGGFAFVPATALVAGLMPVSGILGQRLGGRIRYLLVGGSLAVLISFVYLALTLDTSSNYADSLLPAFLLRGLGIGLFMSASSYAVMSAVPLSKSGLASGTLTMARQIGTSVGVAAFGAVYLHSLSGNLAGPLAQVPPSQAAAVHGRAEHFIATGDGPLRASVETGIVDGFAFIATVGVGMAAFAVAVALTMRLAPRGATAPVSSAGPQAAGITESAR